MTLLDKRESTRALAIAKFLVTELTRKIESVVTAFSALLAAYNDVSLFFSAPALKVCIGVWEDA